jgi:hypothetical protein
MLILSSGTRCILPLYPILLLCILGLTKYDTAVNVVGKAGWITCGRDIALSPLPSYPRSTANSQKQVPSPGVLQIAKCEQKRNFLMIREHVKYL